MGLQAYFDNFATQPSRWSHHDPARCGCHGSGWFLSELDTWHACPAHHVEGQAHPEDDHDPAACAWHLRFDGAIAEGFDTFETALAALKRRGHGYTLTRKRA